MMRITHNATIAEHLEITEKEVMEIVRVIRQYPDASVEELTNEYLKTAKCSID